MTWLGWLLALIGGLVLLAVVAALVGAGLLALLIWWLDGAEQDFD